VASNVAVPLPAARVELGGCGGFLGLQSL